MEPITIRISPNRLEELESESKERDMGKSELIRERLSERDELTELRNELETTLSELRTENNRLNREKRQILDQREEHTDLVESIQLDQTMNEKKSRANIVTRWK